MKQYSTIFFWGTFISFLGSLPPGAINIAAAQIAAQQGNHAALIYALGSMLAEVIVVRLALSGMKQIISHRHLFHILELLTAGLLLTMTVGCFIAATRMGGVNNILPGYYLPPFKTGVLLSAFNPLHIPFWLGWTSVLMNKNILSPLPKQYNCFVLGIGVGTIAGFTTFIYTGEYLLSIFETNQLIICLIVGLVLLTISLLHIRMMIQTPVSVRYTNINNQITGKL
jgi:threonine/homoserine/homoserine lactone efflux protein